jgi:hypothetical protein
VGAAVTAVAANAPKIPRRVMPVEPIFFMFLAPVPSLNIVPRCRGVYIYPQMQAIYCIGRFVVQPLFWSVMVNKGKTGEFLRIS